MLNQPKNIFAVAVTFQSQRSSILSQDFLNIIRAGESYMFYCPLIAHHAVVFMMKLLSAYYLRQFRLWPRKLDKSPPTPSRRLWTPQLNLDSEPCNIQIVCGPFSESLVSNCSKFTANQPANGFEGERSEKSNMSEAESCQNPNLVAKAVKP